MENRSQYQDRSCSIAFALFVVMSVMGYWFKSKRRKIPTAFWIAIILLPAIGVVALVVQPHDYHPSIYRLRVTVLNLDRTPNNEAKVTSDYGGEPKKVEGGWEFDIRPRPNRKKENSQSMPIRRMLSSMENPLLP